MFMNDKSLGPQAQDASSSPVRYVARQPILTHQRTIVGYELLFRSGMEEQFRCADPDQATKSVIDMTALLGFEALCDGGLAFINCTLETLRRGHIALLPPEKVVIEILETIPLCDSLLHLCGKLRSEGYKIALDDFTIDDPRECMAELANFIKVDLKQTSWDDANKLCRRLGSRACAMLAEKVETPEDFAQATQLGFSFFQGYFFGKPKTISFRNAGLESLAHPNPVQPDLASPIRLVS